MGADAVRQSEFDYSPAQSITRGLNRRLQSESPLSVLLIDPNPISQNLYRATLESQRDITVSSCQTVQDAWEMLNALTPNLIVIHLAVESAEAIQFATQIRQEDHTRGIPLLLLTSESESDIRTRFAGLLDDVMVKPFNRHELRSRVVQLVNRQEDSQFVRQHLSVVLSFLQNVLLHEIKTPLSVLKGNNYLLKMVLGSMVQALENSSLSLEDRFVLIRQSIDRMQDMLDNQSRALGRYQTISDEVTLAIEAGDYRLRLRRDLYTISEVINSAVDRLQGSKLDIQINGTSNAFLKVDADRLADVFYHLLDNAGRFNDSPNPVCSINITENRSNGTLEVQIHDNGIGIKDFDRPMIFEPFYVAHNLNCHTKGIGLGLYLSLHIIRAHGGDLELTETRIDPAQSGSTFTIRLPMAERI